MGANDEIVYLKESTNLTELRARTIAAVRKAIRSAISERIPTIAFGPDDLIICVIRGILGVDRDRECCRDDNVYDIVKKIVIADAETCKLLIASLK